MCLSLHPTPRTWQHRRRRAEGGGVAATGHHHAPVHLPSVSFAGLRRPVTLRLCVLLRQGPAWRGSGRGRATKPSSLTAAAALGTALAHLAAPDPALVRTGTAVYCVSCASQGSGTCRGREGETVEVKATHGVPPKAAPLLRPRSRCWMATHHLLLGHAVAPHSPCALRLLSRRAAVVARPAPSTTLGPFVHVVATPRSCRPCARCQLAYRLSLSSSRSGEQDAPPRMTEPSLGCVWSRVVSLRALLLLFAPTFYLYTRACGEGSRPWARGDTLPHQLASPTRIPASHHTQLVSQLPTAPPCTRCNATHTLALQEELADHSTRPSHRLSLPYSPPCCQHTIPNRQQVAHRQLWHRRKGGTAAPCS